MAGDSIEREILIEAPVEVVWTVVTEPDQIAGWFSDSVELDLRPGGEAVFHWRDHESVVEGRVERVEPPHLFSFRWVVGGGGKLDEHNSTLVEFRLSAEGEGTRLTVVESGFHDLSAPEDERNRHYDGHSRGWELELGHLSRYVARAGGREKR
jgi:uncharacterized protein YndB with AHSA1/START domain